jgi:hypothetical protein
VWELFTRRWNAWHWESHCVFTAGSERVKTLTKLASGSVFLLAKSKKQLATTIEKVSESVKKNPRQNVRYTKKKRKKNTAVGIRTRDLWIKKSHRSTLGHRSWDEIECKECVYIAIFITHLKK